MSNQNPDYEDHMLRIWIPFTFPTDPREQEIVGLGLAIAGEAGELANKIKKKFLKGGTSGKDVSIEELIEELGDIQAYSARLAHDLGIRLADARAANLTKLLLRIEGK